MARHEALVDLHRVEWPGAELAEVGDAATEIVDRQARRPMPLRRLKWLANLASAAAALSVTSRINVPDGMALAFMVAARTSSKPGSRNCRLERLTLANKGGVKRKITLPMGQVLRRAFQREAAQLHDQSAFLGMSDKFGWRDQALGGMAPTQQRLEPRHRTSCQQHDGLIEYLDMAVAQRLPEIGFQRHAVARAPASRPSA